MVNVQAGEVKVKGDWLAQSDQYQQDKSQQQ